MRTRVVPWPSHETQNQGLLRTSDFVCSFKHLLSFQHLFFCQSQMLADLLTRLLLNLNCLGLLLMGLLLLLNLKSKIKFMHTVCPLFNTLLFSSYVLSCNHRIRCLNSSNNSGARCQIASQDGNRGRLAIGYLWDPVRGYGLRRQLH